MNNFELQLYNDMFLSLKRGNATNGRKSNAKPLFLLSIIDCIAMQRIHDNIFLYDDDNLVSTYTALARYYKEEITPPLVVPYYHLGSSPFYHLVWKEGYNHPNGLHTPSGKYLRDHLIHSQLDAELWRLLQNAENRDFLKRNIINRFFND